MAARYLWAVADTGVSISPSARVWPAALSISKTVSRSETASPTEPHPGPGEVRIRVHAATVNPTDVALRAGAYGQMLANVQPPYIPGMDAAGAIDIPAPLQIVVEFDSLSQAVNSSVGLIACATLVRVHHATERLPRVFTQQFRDQFVHGQLDAERPAGHAKPIRHQFDLHQVPVVRVGQFGDVPHRELERHGLAEVQTQALLRW